MEVTTEQPIKVMEINGFDNYTINSEGVITTIRTDEPKKYKVKQGRNHVTLYYKGKSKMLFVDELVYSHFCGNYDSVNLCIKHVDGNMLNDKFENLELESKFDRRRVDAQDKADSLIAKFKAEHPEYKQLKNKCYFINNKGEVISIKNKITNIKPCHEAGYDKVYKAHRIYEIVRIKDLNSNSQKKYRILDLVVNAFYPEHKDKIVTFKDNNANYEFSNLLFVDEKTEDEDKEEPKNSDEELTVEVESADPEVQNN